MTSAGTTHAVQQTLDDLGTPLFDVTFVVVDLETTGLSPASDRITEIGAVKVRRGDVLGEFQTLVHPGRAVPPGITAVTGITDHMVAGAPRIAAVLPSFLEFAGDAVLVAHNARFDHSFLDAELRRHGHDPLPNVVLDTARIARRVLRDEVRNVRLRTLASHFRARVMPEHRALVDARATVDVLHGLLERAGSLGATTLEDLRDYTRSSSDRLFRRITLVDDAPAEPGTYRFVDPDGEVLYIGKATDLRTRLRQYFGQDPRRRIADMVRATARVEWVVTPTELEAAVREVRAIARSKPRFNRRSKFPERAVWVKLTSEVFPRLSIVHGPRDDDATYLGPVPTRRQAELLVEAIHDVVPLRRCTMRIRLAQDHAPCVLKDLGRCGAPCDGSQGRQDYARVAATVAGILVQDPTPLLVRLRERMDRLAEAGRFEPAADARRRLHGTARLLDHDRRAHALAAATEVVARRKRGDGHEVVLVRHGRLAATARCPADADDAAAIAAVTAVQPMPVPTGTLGAGELEEVRLVRAWLDARGTRVVAAEGSFAEPVTGGAVLAATTAESVRVGRQVGRDRQAMAGAKIVRRPRG